MSSKSAQENEKGPPRHASFADLSDDPHENDKKIKNSPKIKKTASFSKDSKKHHRYDEDIDDISNEEELEKNSMESSEENLTPNRRRSPSTRRHISRRASIFDFEYEFPNSPPRPTITMITRSSSVNSPFFSNLPSPSRPSSRPYIKPPARIQTPEWEDLSAKKSQNDKVRKNQGRKVNLLKIEENRRANHIQLEYFETRIQNGDDKQHTHPVQAHEMAESGMTIVMTHEEYLKTKRYEKTDYLLKTPKFWEPRVWDKPENQMNESETESLVQNIQLSYENKALDEEEYYHDSAQPSSRRKNKKSKKNRAFLSIPIYDYVTNSSSEDTDWDDCM